MTAWFASGWVIDWILAATVAEAGLLLVGWRMFRRGVPPGACLPNLAAGFCLLLAMRLALGGAWWGYVSAALLGGLGCHLIDLRGRWVRE